MRPVHVAAAGASLVLLASCASPPTSPAAPAAPATPLRPGAPVRIPLAVEGAAVQGGLLKGRADPATQALTLDGKPVPLAPDKAFIIGFDRDAPPKADLVATLADGSRETLRLTVGRAAWAIQHVDAPPRGGASDADFARRRPDELRRIAAARARVTDAAGWRQRFVWPAQGRISGVFGSQRIYRGEPGSYHSGVDVAGGTGTPFHAPADGVVVLAADAPFTLEGRLLIVDHGAGLSSAFLHASKLYVREGARVRQGQPLGEIGATGRATGPHLHWGLVWQDARIDPQPLVGPMR